MYLFNYLLEITAEKLVINEQRHAFQELPVYSTTASQSRIKNNWKNPKNCNLSFLALVLGGDTGVKHLVFLCVSQDT